MNLSSRVLLATFGLALVLSGCAGSVKPLGGAQDIKVLSTDELPVPERVDQLSSERRYLVGPFDRLIIDVFGIEELSQREVQTDASGRISFPMAGVVDAAGKTTAEIEQAIRSRLIAAHIRNPQVTVNLKETISQVVTVDGQVMKPGLYPVIGRMTLMRAVASAQGLSEFAKLEDVVVFRTANGQKYAALYNLAAIRRGAYGDPEIFANDIIIVGDSSAKRLFKDLIQLVPLVTTPMVIAFQNL